MPKNWDGVLHESVRTGKTEHIRKAIFYGADINSIHSDGNTALAKATKCGRSDVMQYLISQKADVLKTGAEGRSPIFWAIYRGHLEALKLLLVSGVNVNTIDTKGNTPLIYASQEGRIKIAEYLINNGADVNKCNSEGTTPLIAAVTGGHLSIVKFLAAKKAEINKVYNDGNTAVALATKYKNFEIVNFLTTIMDADLCKFGKRGKPPLSWAVINGDTNMVQFLLENGAQNSLQIAMVDAVECDNHEIIKILIQEGAFIDCEYRSNATALDIAHKDDNITVTKCFVGQEVNQEATCREPDRQEEN